MEYQRTSLVVLTLLQLCRAEIKDTQPQWYSANIINDGFEPKSISEIFSSEPSFSTTSPIIVSSEFSSSYAGGDASSTLAPPTSLLSPTGFTQATISSLSPELVSPLQKQYVMHMTTSTRKTSPHYDQTSVEIPQRTSPANFDPTHSLVTEVPPQRNVKVQQEQSTPIWTLHPSSIVTETPTIFQSAVTGTTIPGASYEYPTKSTVGPEQMPPKPQQGLPLPPNYFLIYQQAPQSFPNIFNPEVTKNLQQTTAQESYTTGSPLTSTFTPTFSSTPSTISSSGSTVPNSTPSIRTSPVLISTTTAPATQQLSSSTASRPRVTVTSSFTRGSSSISTSRNTRTTLQRCNYPTTPMPSSIVGKPSDGILFPLKIRVLTPSGSITNVNINPINKVPMTTKKPTTTTRRPTTKRTPKPKKNTYDGCLHGCRKHGQTLCAAPLGQNPISPESLRGFPSVCHMACHNSYRKNSYEKIVDGSCSRLRTRIRPIDSNTKLKKDELHKVQYILDNPDQKAIVEFTGLYT